MRLINLLNFISLNRLINAQKGLLLLALWGNPFIVSSAAESCGVTIDNNNGPSSISSIQSGCWYVTLMEPDWYERAYISLGTWDGYFRDGTCVWCREGGISVGDSSTTSGDPATNERSILISTSPITGECEPNNSQINTLEFSTSVPVYDGFVCSVLTVSNGNKVYISGDYSVADNTFTNGKAIYSLYEPKPQISVKGGYIKLDVVDAIPALEDCQSTSDHLGRMVFNAGDDALYVCTSNGWQRN